VNAFQIADGDPGMYRFDSYYSHLKRSMVFVKYKGFAVSECSSLYLELEEHFLFCVPSEILMVGTRWIIPKSVVNIYTYFFDLFDLMSASTGLPCLVRTLDLEL